MGFVDGLDMAWGLGVEGACAALGEAQKRPATLRCDADESGRIGSMREGYSTESSSAGAGPKEADAEIGREICKLSGCWKLV